MKTGGDLAHVEPAKETAAVQLLKRTQENVERLEKENEQIRQVLQNDKKYGARLRKIYENNPQVRKLLLNREAYPDWILDYFVTHEEAVDWVVDYPEYAVKSEEEIDMAALQPIDIKEHLVRGSVPLYLQWDQTWGYASYGTGIIAIDGCGPTCLAMVVTGLTGDASMTPKKVADFSAKNGFLTENSGTSWSLMEEGARKLGIQSRQIEKWSTKEVIKELRKGHLIISSMGPGDFTSQGHFIVLCGVTEDGKIILNDPNSLENSQKVWEAQHLLDQMKSMWTFKLK